MSIFAEPKSSDEDESDSSSVTSDDNDASSTSSKSDTPASSIGEPDTSAAAVSMDEIEQQSSDEAKRDIGKEREHEASAGTGTNLGSTGATTPTENSTASSDRCNASLGPVAADSQGLTGGAASSLWDRAYTAWREGKRTWDADRAASTDAKIRECEQRLDTLNLDYQKLKASSQASWVTRLDTVDRASHVAERLCRLRNKRLKYACKASHLSASERRDICRLPRFIASEERHWNAKLARARTAGHSTRGREDRADYIQSLRDKSRADLAAAEERLAAGMAGVTVADPHSATAPATVSPNTATTQTDEATI